jgi:hypothetical protein
VKIRLHDLRTSVVAALFRRMGRTRRQTVPVPVARDGRDG